SASGINISAGPEQGVGYGPDARPLPETDHRDRHSQENQEHALKDEPAKDSPGSQEKVQPSPQAGNDHHSEEYKQGEENHGLRNEQELSAEERQELQKLRHRDAEVRAHEQAHIAAGGQYVNGGASYSYEKGPDGRQYAVEGEVSIDTSPVPGDPEQTQEKARTVRRAALAPANPSPQDQRIAADAARMEAEARMEQRQEEQEEQQDESGPGQPEAGNSPTSPPPTAMKAAIQAYQSMINSF
ncbi:putative metalloprotease CJM1_0395 family protein, partial [Desulfonatronospira sp. MSAO_Bac3]|uniref:putative metalloprotease CJM1_0395 family protein n=1 Tax=Desulfonatronospira sp. MSAO_Bac3 TaxID=2293857 RepID=UPI0025802E96